MARLCRPLLCPCACVALFTAAPTAWSFTVDAGGPYIVAAEDTVTLDGSDTDAAGCASVVYRWDTDGDGAWDTPLDADPTTTVRAAQIDGPDKRAYAACLDEDGDKLPAGVDDSTLIVDNVPPVLRAIDGPDAVEPGHAGTWTPDWFDPEPADTHTWAAGLPDGAILHASTGEVSWTPTPEDVGRTTIFLEVTDDDGGEDEITWEVNVTWEIAETADTGRPTGTPQDTDAIARPTRPGPKGEGCACTTAPGPAAWAPWLPLAALLALRRRRMST